MQPTPAAHPRSDEPPTLRLHLLGGFRAVRDDLGPVDDGWRRPGAKAVVKVLATAPGRRLHRDQLLDLLWPEVTTRAGLSRLAVALHTVRRAFEPELSARARSAYLISDGESLLLTPDRVWIDADHAERLAVAALVAVDAEDRAARLTAATAAFAAGPLLPEDRYADWAEARRHELEALRARTVLALADALLSAGEPDRVLSLLAAEVTADPVNEALHRRLIRARLDLGHRREAVRQYHLLRDVLGRELGTRPEAETQHLYRKALAEPNRAALTYASVLPAAIRHPPATRLHGRERAVALLTDPEPAVPLVLVDGEAGVGKTRLAAETGRAAVARGETVLWGAGHEGAIPYGALAGALDGFLADCPPEVRAAVGTDYPELAALLPALGSAPAPAGADAGLDPEEQRARLFRATADLLADLAATRPVLLVLDDAQAADAGSLELLLHLVTSSGGRPLRFVVTLREGELDEDDPRRRTVGTLVARGLARRVELMRLSRRECAGLVAELMGEKEGGRAAAGVFALSRGNPLFTAELAAAWHEVDESAQPPRTHTAQPPRTHAAEPDPVREGAPDSTRGPEPKPKPEPKPDPVREAAEADGSLDDLDLPQRVRALVSARVGRLPSPARRVLQLLAAAGGTAPLSELTAAGAGLRPPLHGAELADGVETAVAARLVEEREAATGGRAVPDYAFCHPLVRLAVYGAVSAVRRGQLHTALGEAVLSRRPRAVETLALHFGRADDPRAVDFLRQAAERAEALYANDAAERHYTDLVARLDLAGDPAAAEARLGLGRVLRHLARYAESEEVLDEALAEFRLRGDQDAAVRTAELLAGTLGRAGRPQQGLDLLVEFEPLPADLSPADAAGHRIMVAGLSFVVGRWEEGLRAADEAAGLARLAPAEAVPVLLARALINRCACLLHADRTEEAHEAALRALPLAERARHTALISSALSLLSECALRGGDLDEALSHNLRTLELAERTGDPSVIAFERGCLARVQLLRGEGAAALELAEQAVAEARSSGATWCLGHVWARLGEVHVRAGRRERAEECLIRSMAEAERVGDAQAVDDARVLLDEARALPSAGMADTSAIPG
ncbi:MULTISPECIES: ATP-binding protein [unclassified Streptomyces]|uniref:ATP-binding protein n=1 Tax=unclassified Streptomyces TaxID=2593676 RepID=UPI0036EE2E94